MPADHRAFRKDARDMPGLTYKIKIAIRECREDAIAMPRDNSNGDQMKSLRGQRRKNLLHVLMPFGFERKRNLHFAEAGL